MFVQCFLGAGAEKHPDLSRICKRSSLTTEPSLIMSSDIKRKLDKLASQLPGDSDNRQDLHEAINELREKSAEKRKSRPAIRYHRDMPRTYQSARSKTPPGDDAVKLEEAVEGTERHTSDGNPFYLIENSLCDIEDQAGKLQSAFRAAMQDPDSGLYQRLQKLAPVENISPSDAIFVDLETTGLSCSPLFLIGIMTWDDGELVVRQFLARDYSEEKATIARFAKTFRNSKLLVTFNGKSFDMPYLRMRAATTQVNIPEDPAHFDLLHVCRRAWKDSLPNCKLQTLETHICRRPRYGDIPGDQIPEAYHSFVRTGDARQMINILHHNMLDIITMADLMVRLPPLDDDE